MTEWAARSSARWIDERFRLGKFTRRAVDHVFPDHWSFMLGEIAFYAFGILVITGVFLAMFFNSSSDVVTYHGSYRALDGVKMSAAYQSVLSLSFDVQAGLLIRQMHHWAALIFIAAITVHLARIFFTAAYRKPREVNWLVGVTLLLFAIGNGYLGYSLAGDLLSGAGLRIGYAILLSVPVIGRWLALLFFGGTVPNPLTIPRLYSLHIFLFPAVLAALIGLHVAIIWRQLHTNYPGPRRTDRSIVGSRLWPSYAAKSMGLFLLLFGLIALLAGFVQIDPVWAYGPYDPISIIPGAQPDWYLGWIEGAMRLFPSVNLHKQYLVPNVFFPGVLLPALVFLGLYFYPFFDKAISDDDPDRSYNVLRMPYQQPFNTAFGCAAFMFFLVLFFAGGDDVIAVATGSSLSMVRTTLQALALTVPAVTFLGAYMLCRRARRRRFARRSEVAPALTPELTLPPRETIK